MDKVKRLIAAGASVPTAIKESLGEPLEQFAREIGVHPKTLSAAINGWSRPPEKVIAGLVKKLNGTPDEWRMLLWEAGRPIARAS